MALPTLIATPGASNANSFGTRAEADSYFESVLHAENPWPSNVSATATLGSGDNGVVTITVDTPGTEGNAYTVAAVLGSGNNIPLSASLVGSAITVTLGTNGSGAADPVKNTAILVTAVVSALTGVTASYSGTGSGVIPVTASKSFSDGSYVEETKLPALIMATQQLSALVEWTGDPVDSVQRLPWPRTGMEDLNGNSISSTTIPEALKHASFELARLLIIGDRTEENEIGVNKMTHLRAGPVTMKFRDYGEITSYVMTSAVWNLLVPSWYYSIVGMPTSTRDLLRA